jgi:crossover junction endodeoxyribonuclease RuvC
MRVLAFDPGFERLGVAVVEKESGKEKLLYSDCLRTEASLPFPERLALLGAAVEKLLEKWMPDAVALEDLYFAKNAKTAMKVAEVRGVLVYLAAARGIALYQYTPLQVKIAVTGYGASDKRAVAAMVPRLIDLPTSTRLDDEMDAIAVGLTCVASVRVYPQK